VSVCACAFCMEGFSCERESECVCVRVCVCECVCVSLFV